METVPESSEQKLIRLMKERYLQAESIDSDFSIKLSIKDSYTQLAIVDEEEQHKKEKVALAQKKLFDDLLPSFEQIYGAKKPIEIPDIFKDTETNRALVLG